MTGQTDHEKVPPAPADQMVGVEEAHQELRLQDDRDWRAKLDHVKAERNLFKGKYRSIIALLDDARVTVQEVVDHIEDEGDRSYFGSSNQADQLHDLVDDMDGWSFDAMLPAGDINKMERDPYAEIREQRSKANRALAALKDAVGHIEHMAAFIGAQKLGYSFESLGEDMPGIKDALAPATEGSGDA
jgi:hypothetical protein